MHNFTIVFFYSLFNKADKIIDNFFLCLLFNRASKAKGEVRHCCTYKE